LIAVIGCSLIVYFEITAARVRNITAETANRHVWEEVVDQVGGTFGHSAPATALVHELAGVPYYWVRGWWSR